MKLTKKISIVTIGVLYALIFTACNQRPSGKWQSEKIEHSSKKNEKTRKIST